MRIRFSVTLFLVMCISLTQGLTQYSKVSAAKSKLGLSPEDQKKHDELLQSAKRHERLGYILGGAAILIAVVGIPMSIYLKKQKQAKQTDIETEEEI